MQKSFFIVIWQGYTSKIYYCSILLHWKTYNSRSSPPEVFLGKRVVNNMQQIYRGTPVPKCNFNKVALQLRHGCSPVNFLSEHLFLWTPLKSCFYNSIKSSTILNINSIIDILPKVLKSFQCSFFFQWATLECCFCLCFTVEVRYE